MTMIDVLIKRYRHWTSQNPCRVQSLFSSKPTSSSRQAEASRSRLLYMLAFSLNALPFMMSR